MKVYCPSCFYPNEMTDKVCERCGSPLEWEDESFEEKLIRALDHPESTTALRAARLLSSFRTEKSEDALIKILAKSSDPFIQEAAVASLIQIGTERALPTLRKIAASGFLAPRLRAIEAIGEKGGPEDIVLLAEIEKDRNSSIAKRARDAIEKIKKRQVSAPDR